MRPQVLCLLLLGALGRADSGIAQDGLYAFTTIAGTAGSAGALDGTNETARFGFPGNIVADSAGNLYLSDILNYAIRKISRVGTNWVTITIAGVMGTAGSADGTNSDALFNRPNGVAFGPTGELFVADHYNHTIRRMTPSGTNWIVTTIAGLPGVHGSVDGTNSSARFWSPTGVAVNTAGDVFVADTANFTLRKISPSGTNWVVSTIAGLALSYDFVDGTNDNARFDYPYGVAFDSANHLFVSDWGNHAIREVTEVGTNWVTTTIAGSSGQIGSNDGPGPQAAFNFPNGICTDFAGNIYVSDQSNDTIRKIARSGANWVVSTIAGMALQAGTADGLGDEVRFRHPWGIAASGAGEIFVTDYGNQTIRRGIFLPQLRISQAGSRIVLSWSSAAADYAVERSATLGASASWSPLANAPVTNGPNLIVTDQVVPDSAFYRLSGP